MRAKMQSDQNTPVILSSCHKPIHDFRWWLRRLLELQAIATTAHADNQVLNDIQSAIGFWCRRTWQLLHADPDQRGELYLSAVIAARAAGHPVWADEDIETEGNLSAWVGRVLRRRRGVCRQSRSG